MGGRCAGSFGSWQCRVGAVYGACVGSVLKWFPDRRGLAAGLAVGAYGSRAALTVIPIQRMIERTGYHSAFITWGGLQGWSSWLWPG